MVESPPLHSLQQRVIRYLPFLYWSLWFVAAWLVLVLSTGTWPQVVSHWQMAVAMLFGSYVAGSTPMGGGTVGFPILVLMLDQPASLGRTFSFAIQAVGMSSAALYILCSAQPIARRLLFWASVGATVSLPLSHGFLLPLVSESGVKMTFATLWAVFGVHTLLRVRVLLGERPETRVALSTHRPAGLAVGLLGGVASALTGVGIDMIAYLVLMLAYRVDLRIAVATSVVLMAYASILGSVVTAATTGFETELFYYWLAAAPVVLFGAPFGAFMVRIIPRAYTMIGVALLCIAQWFFMAENVGLF